MSAPHSARRPWERGCYQRQPGSPRRLPEG